ncbi:conserved hypothetical protein [Talaromyces stipitatus ATCC 10500]|uniref:CCHC-type domain-containing protein n=1 Tax=Talaromyces stipitatus (strain ATCC 10500 / CBS 375.48 / QM 6759 / NRRL 1006) TaxID=441959 RepID=B8MII9_TALSN|nr:uncharacterized protein TSTA_045430 [Talaromyces stipitatus ATCC 10500]EED15081.1 conserved hypothetical protein [Talaromyces stipitatus ATCC 10500]
MVKEPGQDSAGKALSADAQKDAKQKRPEDSRQKRPERRLTLDFTDSLEKEFGAAAVYGDGSLDFSVFQKLYENYPEKLFDYVCKRIKDLEQTVIKARGRDAAEDSEYDEEVSSWQEQNAKLQKQVKDQRDAMVELIAEHDDALARMRELAREGTTSTTSISQKKSTKLPNRKRFSGGDDPKFASWLIDVENKLETNADHYPTALARMQYVKSMCEGAAAEHLVPRLQKDSLERYRDADDMIEHLKTIYHNANSVTKAKRELRRLYMNDTKFQDFLSKFVLKAQESELPSSQWKDELYELQASYNENMSYRDFVKEYHQTANQLEIIVENERRAPKNRENKGGNGSGASKDDKKNKSGSDKLKDDKSAAKISWAEKKQLIAKGKCFNYKMKGHMANECELNKKDTPDLKALEAAKKADVEESSESENDDA